MRELLAKAAQRRGDKPLQAEQRPIRRRASAVKIGVHTQHNGNSGGMDAFISVTGSVVASAALSCLLALMVRRWGKPH